MYKHRSRKVARRRKATGLPHPRTQARSRTTRRAGTKTKVVPGNHPAYGPTGHQPPKYRYPGYRPGRWGTP